MQTDDELRSGEQHTDENDQPSLLSVSIFGGAVLGTCCLILPLLVSLSSTGAVLGSVDALGSLRPYLIAGAWVLAALAVIFVVYRRVRRPDASCEPGGAGQPKRSELDSKIAL